MRKKKTLPKNFEELLDIGDEDMLISSLSKCHPDAHKPFSDKTALMYPELPQRVIKWLVSEGADINYSDKYGNTPLSEAACFNAKNVDLILSLGADINACGGVGGTALFKACSLHRSEGVKILMEKGADMYIRCGYVKRTALEEALFTCMPVDIRSTAVISELFLEKGAAVTDEMKKAVALIGKNFEFHRDSFAQDILEATDRALYRLYELFDVPPVPHRKKYGGDAPIKVTGKTWQKQYNELWELLVPGNGHSEYVQGEVIRLAGKLSFEVLDNGAGNWCEDHCKMKNALAQFMADGKAADDDMIKTVKSISPDTDEKTFDAIAKAAVEWILNNPEPVKLGKVNYLR